MSEEVTSMLENWNISGLILEGISGTGKTTILHALTRSERFIQNSAIVLSEHHTQRVLERKEREEGLVVADNVQLLEQHVSYLESLRDRLHQMDWRQNNRTNMRVPYLLERFHFTHVCHYVHMSWPDVEEIDCRLATLNCKVCLLTMDKAMIEQRVIHERDAAWRNYLRRYGETDEEIVDYYAGQQEMMCDLCAKSALDTLIVDTTGTDISRSTEKIMDFWSSAF